MSTSVVAAELLPTLILDCELVEAPCMQTEPQTSSSLFEALEAINSSQDAQSAVDSFIESSQQKYGFGEVAALFDRFARTLNLPVEA